MTRTLMISDIHGCLEQFELLMEKLAFEPERDRLILMGDYVDRGPKSREVVERVMELVERDGATALRGNHDQRLVDLIRRDEPHARAKFMEHGGRQTIASYCGIGEEEIDETALTRAVADIRSRYGRHIDFLAGLPLYYEDESHICVHAGLNPQYADWKRQPEHDFMYIKKDFYRSKTNVGRKVVFGHTRTVEIHGTPDIWHQEDKIGIDGGCAYGYQLNALIFDGSVYEACAVKFGEGQSG